MKVEFLNELKVSPYHPQHTAWDVRTWILKDDFILRITDRKKVCHLLTIPKGFKPDFASVPRFFWRILTPYDAGEASVAHDYIYRTGLLTKAQADKIFLLGMIALWTPKWKRQIMYYAVRWFGNGSYNKFTEEKLNINL